MKRKRKWLTPEGAFKRLKAAEQAELEESLLIEYKEFEVQYLENKLQALEEKGDSNKEEIVKIQKEISESLNKKYKTLLEVVKTQGEAIKNSLVPSVKDIEEKADTFVEALKSKKTELDALKDSTGSLDIEIKGDVTSGSSVEDNTYSSRVPGIGKIPVRSTMLGPRFRSGTLGVNSGGKLTYVDQDNLTRDADNVAECDPIPESDIVWKERDCKAEKIGDSMPICLEALEDFEFIRSEVENFLIENVLLKEDQQLLLGNGNSPQLKGIDSVAQDWSVAAGSPIESLAASVESPTIANVLFTAISQIKNSGENNTYTPNYIDMNPQDYQRMLLEKDADRNSINDQLVSIDSNGTVRVAGVMVVENPLVPLDVVYVGDYQKGTLYRHRNLVLTIATQHGTDFIEDRVRIKGTMRKLLLIRNVYQNAFLKVGSINASLTALAKP